ncbi:4Fe-4S dicluster domain-containing protein [Vibrio sp. SS-MA-C1-2]|uniref:4Fe-4S dicluster domain-containing protein n=1 Tax=Vibrio sp. SS-MA-C1-2 TaxID=2908646 RepID=UPI001F3B6EDF|nr:4Fe-4S dicluster domain-containing protein [Vibrio sp. SS-MA-C1-2]UJF18692.1 4Fe-4S dicluster domain-containing protein [Vibrio sp. SS-MA-C1-2]
MNTTRRNLLLGLGSSTLLATTSIKAEAIIETVTIDSENETILYDETQCIGCEACVEACRETHNLGEKANRLNIVKVARGEGLDTEYTFFRQSCNHCQNAPCLKNCPSNAIERREGGQIVINQEACIGCQTCIDVCPFDMPKYDKQSNTVDKCTGCANFVENGEKQACVSACPTGALHSGSRSEIIEKAKTLQASYQANSQTNNQVGSNTDMTLYGGTALNSYVGHLNLITLIPTNYVEKRLLPANPVEFTMQLRSFARDAVGIGAAITAGTLAMHGLYYFSQRKQQVTKSEEAEKNDK